MRNYFTEGYKVAQAQMGLPAAKPLKVPSQETANNISQSILKEPPASVNVATESVADARARVQAKFSSAKNDPADNVPRHWGVRQPLMNTDNMHTGRVVNSGFNSVDDPTLALHGDISGMGNEDRGAP